MPSLPKIAIYGAGKVGRELLKFLISNKIGRNFLLADPNHTMSEVIDLFNQDFTYGLPESCAANESNTFILTMGMGASDEVTYFQETDRSLLPLGSMDIDVIIDCSGNTENITMCAQQFMDAGAKNAVTIVPSNISSSERNAIASEGGLTLYGINERSHSGKKWYIPDAQYISTVLPSTFVTQYIESKGYSVYNIDLNLQVSNLENSLLNSYTGYGSITGTLTDDSNYIGRLVAITRPELNGKVWNTNVCYPVGNGNVSKISILSTYNLTASDIETILYQSGQIALDGTSQKDKNTSGFFKVNRCGPLRVGSDFCLNYMSKLGRTMMLGNNYTQNILFIGYDPVNVMVCESKFIINFIMN